MRTIKRVLFVKIDNIIDKGVYQVQLINGRKKFVWITLQQLKQQLGI